MMITTHAVGGVVPSFLSCLVLPGSGSLLAPVGLQGGLRGGTRMTYNNEEYSMIANGSPSQGRMAKLQQMASPALTLPSLIKPERNGERERALQPRGSRCSA